MLSVSKATGRILRALTGILVPQVCAVCGRSLVEGEGPICTGCLMALPRTWLHRHPFNTMHQRLDTKAAVRQAGAWFYYNTDSPFADVVRHAKYRDMPRLARFAGMEYGKELAAEGRLADIDVVIPVPMHWSKEFVRGYNQAEYFAKGLAEMAGCPVGDNLVALRSHKSQTHQSRTSRVTNVAGVYGLRHSHELEGLHVAIVDDVCTTGSTLSQCALAVRAASPASIDVFTMATASRI